MFKKYNIILLLVSINLIQYTNCLSKDYTDSIINNIWNAPCYGSKNYRYIFRINSLKTHPDKGGNLNNYIKIVQAKNIKDNKCIKFKKRSTQTKKQKKEKGIKNKFNKIFNNYYPFVKTISKNFIKDMYEFGDHLVKSFNEGFKKGYKEAEEEAEAEAAKKESSFSDYIPFWKKKEPSFSDYIPFWKKKEPSFYDYISFWKKKETSFYDYIPFTFN